MGVKQLLPVEAEREYRVREVACVVCDAGPGEVCTYEVRGVTGRRGWGNYPSHVGRYRRATELGLVPPLPGHARPSTRSAARWLGGGGDELTRERYPLGGVPYSERPRLVDGRVTAKRRRILTGMLSHHEHLEDALHADRQVRDAITAYLVPTASARPARPIDLIDQLGENYDTDLSDDINIPAPTRTGGRRRGDIAHGTDGGAAAHRRRGEGPCHACQVAKTAAQLARNQRRRHRDSQEDERRSA